MAPRQAPAVVQARGRGAVQGHHRGLRGAPGSAGEQGGVRGVQRRPGGREGRSGVRRRRPGHRRAHGADAQRRLWGTERARHAGEGIQEGV
uniref:Uncharacterized protein n=1 Tax=Arundo donax TaxID=35708 RepID=A0A0A9E4V0_ARUDO